MYCDGPVAASSIHEWTELWSWELTPIGIDRIEFTGSGIHSKVRMARVITTPDLLEGTRWVFRLDQIEAPAGKVTDQHRHPGPGIRCLIEGTFNVHQAAESRRDLLPGEPWWENGTDAVIAWGSPQIATRFVRGLIIPAEWETKRTGTPVNDQPRSDTSGARGKWDLFVNQVIEI